MKRMKRLNIRRIALGFAFAALIVPAAAQAKPVPGSGPILNGNPTSQDPAYQQAVSRGNVYIPLQGTGITSTVAPLPGGPDDRAVSRATSEPVVSLNRGWGPVIAYTDEGQVASKSPDDRVFSKATSVGQVPYNGKVESGDDTSKYAASAFALVLLAMSGITLVVWRNRKGGKLSPA